MHLVRKSVSVNKHEFFQQQQRQQQNKHETGNPETPAGTPEEVVYKTVLIFPCVRLPHGGTCRAAASPSLSPTPAMLRKQLRLGGAGAVAGFVELKNV